MSNTTDELLQLVRKHLIDVDEHGYVEGEDDVVATKELAALIHRTQLEAAEKTMDFLGDYKDWGMVKREVLLAELQAALEKQA